MNKLSCMASFVLTSVCGFSSTIGPNCASCQGGIYALTYSNFQLGSTNDTFDLFLTIDTTSLNIPAALYIDAVAPKPSSSVVSALLLTFPASSPGGSGWDTNVNQGLGAGGCTNGGSGFICTTSTGNGAPLSNTMNSWSWFVTTPHNTPLTGADGASFKVLYTNADGVKVGGLVSENITLTPDGQAPEPATCGLIAAGLLGMTFLRKRA
jgi:hypothetical protein